MYLKIDDINIYYEIYGFKKQALIILGGWGNQRKTFSYLINYLKNYFTIYILDYPGFGNSTFNKDYTIYDYANLINQFIIILNIPKPILIGHSFGGRIIAILVSRYQEKFKKILLMDVAGLKERRFSIYWKQKLYKFLKIITNIFPKIIKKKIQKALFKKFSSNDYKLLDFKLHKTFQNIIKENLNSYYKNINLETLILWGEFDNITSLKMAKKLNKIIKNSTLIIIKNTKHFPYLERPYLVSKIIYEYLKKDIIE